MWFHKRNADWFASKARAQAETNLCKWVKCLFLDFTCIRGSAFLVPVHPISVEGFLFCPHESIRSPASGLLRPKTKYLPSFWTAMAQVICPSYWFSVPSSGLAPMGITLSRGYRVPFWSADHLSATMVRLVSRNGTHTLLLLFSYSSEFSFTIF